MNIDQIFSLPEYTQLLPNEINDSSSDHQMTIQENSETSAQNLQIPSKLLRLSTCSDKIHKPHKCFALQNARILNPLNSFNYISCTQAENLSINLYNRNNDPSTIQLPDLNMIFLPLVSIPPSPTVVIPKLVNCSDESLLKFQGTDLHDSILKIDLILIDNFLIDKSNQIIPNKFPRPTTLEKAVSLYFNRQKEKFGSVKYILRDRPFNILVHLKESPVNYYLSMNLLKIENNETTISNSRVFNKSETQKGFIYSIVLDGVIKGGNKNPDYQIQLIFKSLLNNSEKEYNYLSNSFKLATAPGIRYILKS